MKTYDMGADPYGAEESAIANKRRLAELLMSSAAQGPAFSKGAGVAKALSMILAQSDMRGADKERIALAGKREAERTADMDRMMEFVNQKPVVGGDMPQVDDDGNQMPGNVQDTAAKKMELAKLLVRSRNPQLAQLGLSHVMPKGPGKVTYQDAGDRMLVLDEGGNVVRELPKGVTPDAKFSRTTVSADKVYDKSTVGAEALLTDDRTRSEGAANRGVTVRGQNLTDGRVRAEGDANREVSIRGQDLSNERARETADRAREAAANKPVSESERTAGGYAMRMEAAEKILGGHKTGDLKPGVFETLYTTGNTKVGEMAANSMPIVGRSDARQSALQAQQDWVRAKLRKESGAVIGEQEMENEIKTYFPQIGEGERVIKQKAAARAKAIEAMRMGAGRTASSDAPAGPKPGVVVDGFRFKGGNPNDRANWEPAQ